MVERGLPPDLPVLDHDHWDVSCGGNGHRDRLDLVGYAQSRLCAVQRGDAGVPRVVYFGDGPAYRHAGTMERYLKFHGIKIDR